MKYKSLKPITLKAIHDEGVLWDCKEFMDFVKDVVDERLYYAWMEIPHDFAQETLLFIKPVSTWFIDHGFIEEIKPEKPEEFWRYGEWVMNDKYRIVQCEYNTCCLIADIDGNRKNSTIKVKDINKITLSEMRRMGYKGD